MQTEAHYPKLRLSSIPPAQETQAVMINKGR